MASTRMPSVPVSWGELLDKMTILEIKAERLKTLPARKHVDKEYRLLHRIGVEVISSPAVATLLDQLKQVNERLWDIEDAIREQEAARRFGSAFIELARSVYKMNDQRAAIKRRINERLRSELVEEKSYSSFIPAGHAAAAGASANGISAGEGNC